MNISNLPNGEPLFFLLKSFILFAIKKKLYIFCFSKYSGVKEGYDVEILIIISYKSSIVNNSILLMKSYKGW